MTASEDPQAPEVFHWVNVFISNAKAFLDGTYHGRGRARRQLYFEECVYRFNRRRFGHKLPEHLLIACIEAAALPYAA